MINRVVLEGRLVQDAEVKKTQSGISLCEFTLAVPEPFKEKEVNYIKCQAWRQSADYLGRYAKKGDEVSVDGHLNVSSYDKDGQKVYVTKAVAERVSVRSRFKGDTERNSIEDEREPVLEENALESLETSQEDLPF